MRSPRRRSLRRLRIATDGSLDPVVGGQLLLFCAGVISSLAAPFLAPDRAGWIALGVVTLGMCVLFAGSMLAPLRLSRRGCLVFPAAVCVALVALSVNQPGFVAPLTGLVTLCFAYIGLTQAPGTSLFAVPIAAITFLIANGGLSVAIAVRLFIGMCIWVLLAELLAGSTARQARMAAALRAAAHTDVLTGVSNRRGLQLRLALAAAGDTIVICDLDSFKIVNDTLGHVAGDRVLADFGSLLRASLRDDDYCARYGGEEFVLALAATTTAEALGILQRLRENWALMQPTVTFSAGVANCRADRPADETLAAADRALYVAKAAGRNADRTELSPVPAE